jgi:hypothetical protein
MTLRICLFTGNLTGDFSYQFQIKNDKARPLGGSKVFLKIVQVFVKGFLQAPQR